MGRVILREEDHKYINLDNPDYLYTSVTTVLHKYEVPFDADFHSKRIALRDGREQQDILDEWKENPPKGIKPGTMALTIEIRQVIEHNL